MRQQPESAMDVEGDEEHGLLAGRRITLAPSNGRGKAGVVVAGIAVLTLVSYLALGTDTLATDGVDDVADAPELPTVLGPHERVDGFVLGCMMQEPTNTRAASLCMTSVCTLLATTNPDHVVVMLDELMEAAIGETLRLNGIHLFRTPDVNTSTIVREGSQWPDFSKMPKRKIPIEVYSAKKYYAWTLLQFNRLVYVDGTDTRFQRNASGMLYLAEPFAAVTSAAPQPRCPGYFNNGALLLRPGLAGFHALMSTYFQGNFTYCGGSGGHLDDQDPMISVALTGVLGPVHEWPCGFNYRSWKSQVHCPRRVVEHHSYSDDAMGDWPDRARDGRCRPSPPRTRLPVLCPAQVAPHALAKKWTRDGYDASTEHRQRRACADYYGYSLS